MNQGFGYKIDNFLRELAGANLPTETKKQAVIMGSRFALFMFVIYMGMFAIFNSISNNEVMLMSTTSSLITAALFGIFGGAVASYARYKITQEYKVKLEEKKTQLNNVIVDPQERKKQKLFHDERSLEVVEYLKSVDSKYGNKLNLGNKDNEEHITYLIDAYFEEIDIVNK